MAYSTDISKTLADQLAKFVTYNRHQLAGQVANLDFWTGEARHCLQVIDEYSKRFERMKSAQMKYVAEHGTVIFNPNLDFPTDRTPPPPKQINHRDLAQARQSLCEALYRFLARSYRESLIDEPTFMQTLDQFGISHDPADLR
jgi:hypothetical protein